MRLGCLCCFILFLQKSSAIDRCHHIAIIWKPLSSDRSDNNCWDRTFSISAIVVAAIAGEWWLWSLLSLNFLGSEFPHPGCDPFHDIVFIVSAVALINQALRQTPILIQTIFLWIENVIPLRVESEGSEVLVTCRSKLILQGNNNNNENVNPQRDYQDAMLNSLLLQFF